MYVADSVELVRYNDLTDGNFQVQVAVNGVLAPMIDDHKSHKAEYDSDEAYFKWVAHMSKALIHLYGDARNPFSESLVQGKQQEGF